MCIVLTAEDAGDMPGRRQQSRSDSSSNSSISSRPQLRALLTIPPAPCVNTVVPEHVSPSVCSCGSDNCSGDSGFSEADLNSRCGRCGFDCGGLCARERAPERPAKCLCDTRTVQYANITDTGCRCGHNSGLQEPVYDTLRRNNSGETLTNSGDRDLETLSKAQEKLAQCGFYYTRLSMEDAKRLLKSCPPGVFLLRDSSHSKFLYALSVQTPRGTTSVRIEYKNGLFRLDCERRAISQLPSFDCVVKLVQYYMGMSLADRPNNNNCVWLESSGRRDTPVILTEPLIRPNS